MTNSWSLLFDEMNMSNQDYWYEDGFSLTGNPGAFSSDTISFSSTTTFGAAEATDSLTLYGGYGGNDTLSFDLDMSNKDPNRYKYSEDVILEELKDYISGTYNQHYSAVDARAYESAAFLHSNSFTR